MGSGEGSTLVVRAKSRVADDVVSLALQDPAGSLLPAWHPGAHIGLRLPCGTRHYSLCGGPEDRTTYRVLVALDRQSRGGSRHVHDHLEPGDVLGVEGPLNRFPLVPDVPTLFIAGGIGITPFLPMLAAVEARGTEWALVYGGRSLAAMPRASWLADVYPGRVTLVPHDLEGLIDVRRHVADGPRGQVYCCGPAGLIDAVERECSARGLPLRVERFTPVVDEGSSRDRSFVAVCARSGCEIEVGAHESLLDALLREGIDIESSCEEGACGTCETPVVEGPIDHRDVVLTEDERQRGDTMMVCVSRGAGDRIVIDV